MTFDRVIGQKRVKSFFSKALQNERMGHAYLFIGDAGIGKQAMAIELAKALLCGNGLSCTASNCADCSRVGRLTHPDFHYIFPAPAKVKEDERTQIIASLVENPYTRVELWANPSISIEQIRDIRRKAAYRSFEGRGRVVVITDCDRMTIEAANSLLKILEEPPDKMKLIMTSSRPNVLLPTITSRCQEVKFDPLTVQEIEDALVRIDQIDKKEAALLARLASGSYRRAVELLGEDLQQMQEHALDFFRKSVQNQFVQMEYVEEILRQWRRDNRKVKELLSMLAIWLRDAQVYKETGGQEALIVHYEQIEILEKFTTKFPTADLFCAVDAVENALNLINRNVQTNLILIVLLNKLRGFVRR